MRDKASLRKEYIAKRAELTNESIHDLSLQIANQVVQLDIWTGRTFHLFLPIEGKNEVRTEYILQILQGRDKNVVLSRSNFETSELRHFLLTDQTIIKTNKYGIPEPQEDDFEVGASDIDVVFVPLLCVDSKGHRIGYGKGFYDRFLAECSSSTIKIGLSFFDPLNIEMVTNSTDVALDQLVTPSGIIRF